MKTHAPSLVALSIASFLCACAPEDDAGRYQDDLLTIQSMGVETIAPNEPGVVLVTIRLENDSDSTVNNVTYAVFQAGGASAKFDVEGLTGALCPPETRPWDVAPGDSREIRMRVDLRADPARLDVACQRVFTDARGFDAGSARRYETPREGSFVPADGTWSLELQATLDSSQHAAARASAVAANR